MTQDIEERIAAAVAHVRELTRAVDIYPDFLYFELLQQDAEHDADLRALCRKAAMTMQEASEQALRFLDYLDSEPSAPAM